MTQTPDQADELRKLDFDAFIERELFHLYQEAHSDAKKFWSSRKPIDEAKDAIKKMLSAHYTPKVAVPAEGELGKALDAILPAIWNAGHKYGRLIRNIDGTPKQITDAKAYLIDTFASQTPKPTQLAEGELSPELFNELWDTSLALKDTRRKAEEWYNHIKGLIASQAAAAQERSDASVLDALEADVKRLDSRNWTAETLALDTLVASGRANEYQKSKRQEIVEDRRAAHLVKAILGNYRKGLAAQPKEPQQKNCNGAHCKCMNPDCPSPHHGDHVCPFEQPKEGKSI